VTSPVVAGPSVRIPGAPMRALAALMKDVRDDLLAPSGLTAWARALEATR
jgi:hypothetical protein